MMRRKELCTPASFDEINPFISQGFKGKVIFHPCYLFNSETVLKIEQDLTRALNHNFHSEVDNNYLVDGKVLS